MSTTPEQEPVSAALNELDSRLGDMETGFGILKAILDRHGDGSPLFLQIEYLMDAQNRLRVEADAAMQRAWNEVRKAGL